MIDPIIFTIRIGNFAIPLHWYGVLAATGMIVASWVTSLEINRRKENPDYFWDALIWILPAGVVGARLWYVANYTLGGGTRYLENPVSILNIKEGGLHYFGGILFGIIVLYFYVKRHKLDLWLLLDSVTPTLLIGQAVARPANFINQELYGPPTDLPWGISISPSHRIPPWNNLELFPEGTTHFHPTFAYEMIWNFAAAGLLIWLGRKFPNKFKPGAMTAGWLIMAGIGRIIIETWRPDQPKIPGTGLSYSWLVAVIMAVFGIAMLLLRYEIIRLPFTARWRDNYFISPASTSEATAAVK